MGLPRPISYIKLKNVILNAEQLNKRSSFYTFIPAVYLRIWNQSVFNIQKSECSNEQKPGKKISPASYLNTLSGALIPGLKLLLNGTSRCSPFMHHLSEILHTTPPKLAFQSLRALQCQAEAEYANGLEFLQRCLKPWTLKAMPILLHVENAF
ncbi:hypothetical protein T01_8780 [Trichinella spiralis]|uniref:Uncharacterized protein n=1 Tax=Trichinella spiralis TaxID=6334 RepID=A0A0V1BN01_TRISP|nr:hypothetical protein T01_8780 [Trichinella spiralis]